MGDPFAYLTTSLTGYPVPSVMVTDGALPVGLSLDPATGAITGTPGTAQFGDFPITLTASNGVDPAASLDVTLSIDKDDVEELAPSITGLAQRGHTLTAQPGPMVPADVDLTRG